MKYLMKSAIPSFLLFSALCFPQSATKVQESQSKSAGAATVPTQAPDAIFPAVVARVNGDAILGRDLEELVRRELSSIGNPKWGDLRGEYRGAVTLEKITTLINSKLLYQEAIANGIKATDAEVQTELQNIAKTFKNEAEMNAALANQKKNRESLKQNIYENLTEKKYVAETVGKKIAISPEEVASYYSKHAEEFRHPDVVRTRHILIKAEGDSPEQDAAAKTRAQALLSRIRNGEDIAKLAGETSMDSLASRGGDAGFFSKDSRVPEYSKEVFSLPIGSVRLFKAQHGYYVVKVIDNKKKGLFSLEDIKPQLAEVLKKIQYQEELNNLVKQIRQKSKIEILVSAKELLNP